MRILVLGAGGVGGCFGGRFAESGADVTFLVRPRRRAQLDEKGLVVHSGFGDIALPVTTIASDEITEPYDVVLLSCKAYDLDDAMAAIAPAMGPDSVVLPLLNGLRQIESLQARFGVANVWGGVCYIGAAFDSNTGEIRHFGDFHRIAFGELDGKPSARADAFAALDQTVESDIELSADIVQTMWDKFAMLCALTTANTITGSTIGEILEAPSGEAFLLAALAENRDSAAALGHPVSAKTLELYNRMFTTRGSPFAASMLRDMQAGRPTEGEHVIGDMVRRAEARGLETPMLR
ncbi:MAG: ketopantoate reductase family protein, partial [Alphaproteobacteria bacterium]|nr:ketopantoate reductase family protein [Alphaproteobacteria bacterium]